MDGAMASRETKGKKVATSSKGFKRHRKGNASSSLVPWHPLLGGLELRQWRIMGSNDSMPKTKPNMPLRLGFMMPVWHLFPTIHDTVRELGLGYVFAEPGECNLTLVREFYVNWSTSYRESTKIKVRGQVVHFTARSFNAFLGTPLVDLEMYFLLLGKLPYNDIHHTFCKEHSAARWAEVILPFIQHSPSLT
ncbi:hypothetical protein HAX54_028311 [Datura stramonium]|uniref:Uncharacterized protein n=1 Tax=Datura stramonium TaxID=4076 RepID=A0ABS8V557_DATST|nr:hypothetical protein [Datura stramonium]